MTHHSAPGTTITRRLALHGALAVPALGMLSRAKASSRASAGDIDDFLRRWTDETAAVAKAEDPGEDAYLHRLCADLADLTGQPFPERKAVAFDGDGMQTGPILAAMPFLVLQIDLEPGAVIRAHNHVGWSFVSLGVQGEASVKHFETVGEAPEPAVLDTEFQVREVQSCVLTRGITSSLTRTRANIHWFQAGEDGARLIDFGINLPNPGDGPRTFSVMDFDPEPSDRRRRIHRAKWLGNIYEEK